MNLNIAKPYHIDKDQIRADLIEQSIDLSVDTIAKLQEQVNDYYIKCDTLLNVIALQKKG